MEKGSDIKTDVVFNGDIARYTVTPLLEHSEIEGVQYNCGDGGDDKIVESNTFICKYRQVGEYNVLYLVYTTVGNMYLYSDSVSVTEITSGSSYTLPSLLMMVIFALLSML